MRKYATVKGRMAEVRAERAKTLVRKALGLILESKLYPLLFEFEKEKQWSFHTFLVLKPVDFIFIDREKRVVEVQYGVRPFQISIKPKIPVKYVLELPEGTGSLFRIGEKLEF